MLQPDARNHAPTSQVSPKGDSQEVDASENWMERARSAFYASTHYVDANYRKQWEDSILAFNNQHPNDSKYNHPSYEKRSRIFRPKTRAIIRKNEAAAAAAFFSNTDVVDITPQDQNSKSEQASADIMKQLLQYRLTKSIPWFQIVLGGLQDAQTTGVVCAHVKWDYKESRTAKINIEMVVAKPVEEKPETEPIPEDEYPEQGKLPVGAMAVGEPAEAAPRINEPIAAMAINSSPPAVLSDRPAVDLIPVENLRIDPGANWIDPINTSPYLIHLIPMYAQDVRERMATGEWMLLGDNLIDQARDSKADSTRMVRNKGRDDPYSSDGKSVGDYEIVWVQRHIHRKDGDDWEFYTLSDLALLTRPKLLREVVLHGIRPYVMGNCIIETHKIMPSGVAQLGRGLQEETNEVANQRLDNVKFVLNKKWFVRRGKEADIGGLVRNVPGGVVMLDDPVADVREVNWEDVTASAFQEQVGINLEMDELLGNFNPGQMMLNGPGNNPARNMQMLSQSTGTLVEYLLRTYVETFVQPVLRHLVRLEQAYETDQVVLKIAAKRAELFQKYGIDEVTDDLLEQELTLSVNVGMGATDPTMKLTKFVAAMSAYTQMMLRPVPGLNMQEVGKEIFGNLGYSDGSRFFTTDNPQVAMLQQQLQQAMGVIQQLQQKVKDKSTGHVVGLQKSRETNQANIVQTQIREDAANKRALATHFRALMEADQQGQIRYLSGQPVSKSA